MGDFTLSAFGLDGSPLGWLDYKGCRYARALSGGSSLECATWLDLSGQRLDPSKTRLHLYEDETLLFVGVIAPPLETTPDGLKVQAQGPLLDMTRQRDAIYDGGASQNLETILGNLVTQENARGATHLAVKARQGAALGSLANYTLELGADVAQSIVALATTEPGFYFRMLPPSAAQLAAGTWELLEPWNPAASGIDRSASVRFEYGKGTRDNLVSYALSQRSVINAVTMVGSSEGGATRVRVTDGPSISAYGLREVTISASDNDSVDVLTKLGNAQLHPEPDRTLAFTPQAGAEVPRLLREFDVGDLVDVVIRDGAVNVEETVRIVSGVLLPPDQSSEASQELVVELA